jgi:hypothetical protein
MKNSYCDLSEKEIKNLPEKYQPFLFSPFQFNLKNGFILVPEDTFKNMIDLITEIAIEKQ